MSRERRSNGVGRGRAKRSVAQKEEVALAEEQQAPAIGVFVNFLEMRRVAQRRAMRTGRLVKHHELDNPMQMLTLPFDRWLTFLVILSALTLGCAGSSTGDNRILVPRDATNIDERTTPNGTQLSFDVERKYPDLGWDHSSLKVASASKWRTCYGPDFGRWRVYGDKTATPPRLVHQHSTMVVMPGRALIIVGNYYSRLPIGGFPLSILPDNNRQHVTVMDIVGTERDIETTRSIFDANCTEPK